MFTEFKEPNYDTFILELQDIIKEYEKKVEAITKKSSKNYNEIVKPLEELDEALSLHFTPLSHLNSVSNTKQTQETYEAALPLLSNFHTKLSHNKALYERIKDVITTKIDEQRVLNEMIKDFELAGVNLENNKKERLEAIDMELSKLSNIFSQNLLNATNAYTLIIEDENDIKGIQNQHLSRSKKKITVRSFMNSIYKCQTISPI